MKKICAFLTCILFLQSLLICCSQEADIKIQKEMFFKRMYCAAIAGLVAQTTTSSNPALYKPSIKCFAKALATNTPDTYQEYWLQANGLEFFMAVYPITYSNDQLDYALKAMPTIHPIAIWQTQKHPRAKKKEYETFTATDDHGSREIIINDFEEESGDEKLFVMASKEDAGLTAQIGSHPHINTKISTLKWHGLLAQPFYPESTVAIAAEKPKDPDGSSQTIKIWAIAPELL